MVDRKVVILNNKGQKLVGHYAEKKSDTIIIFCHGLESFTAFSKELQPFFEAYYRLGFSLFWFDFTGYGESEGTGKYNHSQRVADIGSILQYFNGKYKKIILVGISLGTIAAAIAATTYKEISKLYLVNGYYDFRLTYPKFYLFTIIGFLTNREVQKELLYALKHLHPERITIPTLIVVGEKDALVNPKQSINFYNKLKSKKKLIKIPNGDHALLDMRYMKRYLEEVAAWLKE